MEFTQHARASAVLDKSWLACQQTSPGNFCWVGFVDFVATQLTTAPSPATCQSAQSLGCCFASANEVEWSFYFGGILNKTNINVLAAIPALCQQHQLTVPTQVCGGLSLRMMHI